MALMVFGYLLFQLFDYLLFGFLALKLFGYSVSQENDYFAIQLFAYSTFGDFLVETCGTMVYLRRSSGSSDKK